MFIQDREAGRLFFLDIWKKYQASIPLQALEELILGVILEHPEYHILLSNEVNALLQEYTPETGEINPFLHMGMHIAIREQIGSDRPGGIAALYQQLLSKFATAHDLEHRIMECLGEALWSAQRNNTLPDEAAYLECVKRINR
ncbi:MAG: DUF1841 family protein [Gammaproteobacteria bacterium]|nr:DUF1841 family protein [Gammaproteobacteria bacterium]